MGKPPNLFSFADTDELARNFRAYLLEAQNAALARHGQFRVAVSGGSLPKVLAQALLMEGTDDNDVVRFAQWHIFFADERAVPLDHADSNYRLVKEDLVDKIPAERGRPTVYPIDTALLDDLQELADAYEKTLVGAFAARDSVRIPTFDLALLGCGPDGHTCSLFPGHEALREQEAWVLPVDDSPKPPPRRVTLSLPVVTHALKIGFLATGEGKKDILHRIFDTDEGRALPSGLVNETAQDRVSWFTDAAAVQDVQFPSRKSVI